MRQILAGPKAVWGTPAQGTYSLVACIDAKLVGQLDLPTDPNSPRHRHIGSVGMAVHDEHHGRGIGSALMHVAIDMVDNWLNLQKIKL